MDIIHLTFKIVEIIKIIIIKMLQHRTHQLKKKIAYKTCWDYIRNTNKNIEYLKRRILKKMATICDFERNNFNL